MKKRFLVVWLVAAVISGLSARAQKEPVGPSEAPVPAEQKELRISKQYGINYLPLIVLEGHKLIEKNAQASGLGEVKVEWLTFGGGSTANDALLSGNVDLISGGVAPALILWDKTKGAAKLLAALDRSPLILNSTNPEVKSIRDFSEKDKIAVPSVKVSIQALTLQIAAAKAFGQEQYDRIDPWTVALPHPDALVALTSGKSEITAHFTNEPFASIEQQDPRVHQVFRSYDVLGGPHTANLVTTSERFYNNNPRLVSVIIKSLNEADAWINANKHEAALLYLSVTNSKEPVELIEKILNNPDITYTTKPLNINYYSDFLYSVGTISSKPEKQEDLFFPKVFE
ncbi:MAG: ABC transporter substrate-binding protein [Treponema sp.]|jgi:NitT/TauT family transport system substrate-binding protein|nr:ABC transporter substrate-binding protein [Treponema sp.]